MNHNELINHIIKKLDQLVAKYDTAKNIAHSKYDATDLEARFTNSAMYACADEVETDLIHLKNEIIELAGAS